MPISCWFRKPGLLSGAKNVILEKLKAITKDGEPITNIDTELCFYAEHNDSVKELSSEDEKKILWILSVPFEEESIQRTSYLTAENTKNVIEVGPRLNFSTAFSTNAVSMCHAVGLTYITRIEYSTRYLLVLNNAGGDGCLAAEQRTAIENCLHDQMTQCIYREPVATFELDVQSEEVFEVDLMGQGRQALEKANTELGLAFDDWDLDYYTELFKEKVGRNPTSVECFDLAQSNSEHSRHWFFKGRMVVDGTEQPDSLFKMVMRTQEHSNPNNVIKFNDNSSAIEGYTIKALYPKKQTEPSSFTEETTKRHIIFTAETHNFPTGVAPFPGATTGTGGRIRDVQATGRGAHVIAGAAGYSFGNLNMEGYELPWEDPTLSYPPNFAPPVQIAIEASNGASDYGNKFGEPVLTGFARSFGLDLPDGRREWVKPIMFSSGIGSMESAHEKKYQPEKGMEVIKMGGPVYRIGVGGGAASSIQVQGDNKSSLDFGAVQRGDPEMEQKLNRLIRACIERKENNPIRSIHDQGAGGNGNVLKEISEPAGAEIRTRDFALGDPTISVLELWGAEYQETNAALIKAEDVALLTKIGNREKCPVSFVGSITGDGKIRLIDNSEREEKDPPSSKKPRSSTRYPVDLDLELVLGSMPRKVFNLDHSKSNLSALSLPDGLGVKDALDRVLRLPAVASKRYLTNKVDRSVTGLVAQQQCVGPLHTPLADVAVVALSHLSTVGMATAIGEQPIKGLLDAAAGARMSVAEALTNLAFAPITDLKDVKCSGNWMWAAKLPGEGALLYDACAAMCDVMGQLGIAVDGGKDSLSMAARVNQQTVKAPGTLVVSTYVGCPDITRVITPDFKCPNGQGSILYVPLSPGKHRLGGSALAQCYKQIGSSSPDLEDVPLFVRAFEAVQKALMGDLLLSGHDVSDGGLITCVLEMAFAGNCGAKINIITDSKVSTIDALFAEELGWILEVDTANQDAVDKIFKEANVSCHVIGQSTGQGKNAKVVVKHNDEVVMEDVMVVLRDIWEETSFRLERLQTNPECAKQEQDGLKHRKSPPYKVDYTPLMKDVETLTFPRPRVAVIREEGSNGDREMVAAFHLAGCEVWDVTMQDMCQDKVTLDRFRGVVFVGGFSYADVMGSAKGWAATLLFNAGVQEQFSRFYGREDTFSLGVCNGCQLMALLGWVAPQSNTGEQGVHLSHNVSERFESRFCTVSIEQSPAMMLQGMEGATLGIWVAHGEGRMVFKNPELEAAMLQKNLVPVRYVDDEGSPTTAYPFNPNGSPSGMAALCSPNGRHLAIMPHPERCVLPWQWAWQPSDWSRKQRASPWMKMFQNAYDWCVETSTD